LHLRRAALLAVSGSLAALIADKAIAATRQAERASALSAYFEPRAGTSIEVDPVERRDAPRGFSPLRLRGYITVTPPKGRCIVLTRLDSEPDDRVCKRTTLSFKVEDLDRLGRLTWRAKLTDEGDAVESVPLTWTTPYRVAVVRRFDANETEPPTYEVVSGCTAKIARPLGRQVHLSLLLGGTWVVRLPEKDQLVPQPPPVPNLVITKSGGKVSVKEAADKQRADGPKSEAKGTDKKPDEGHGAKAGEEHGDKTEGTQAPEDPEAAEIAEAERMAVSQHKDRAQWGIPARGAYGMSSDHFIPHGTVTPGLNGECRYTFQGPPEDETTGRIECHRTDGYQHVYIPVTCIGELRGK
jgi:hypothetical protein